MGSGMLAAAIHIHCGDCAGGRAREAGLPGEVVAWRDSAAVGPCAGDPAEHRRLRAAWWQVDPARMQDPHTLPRDRPWVLWFGPDPWEQVALLELLAGAPEDGGAVSLVPLERGVGETPAAALAPRYERRGPAPERGPLRRLWQEFCADDRAALTRAAAELRGHPRLPHLAAALARVLADRRDGLTQRRVRALVRGGVVEVPELMRRLRALEAPMHGAWYGDVVVARLRDAAVADLK